MVHASWQKELIFRNKQVCIIDDVVTTGGQILLSAEDLRSFGTKLSSVICVVERNPEGRKNLKKQV